MRSRLLWRWQNHSFWSSITKSISSATTKRLPFLKHMACHRNSNGVRIVIYRKSRTTWILCVSRSMKKLLKRGEKSRIIACKAMIYRARAPSWFIVCFSPAFRHWFEISACINHRNARCVTKRRIRHLKIVYRASATCTLIVTPWTEWIFARKRIFQVGQNAEIGRNILWNERKFPMIDRLWDGRCLIAYSFYHGVVNQNICGRGTKWVASRFAILISRIFRIYFAALWPLE